MHDSERASKLRWAVCKNVEHEKNAIAEKNMTRAGETSPKASKVINVPPLNSLQCKQEIEHRFLQYLLSLVPKNSPLGA